MKQYDVLIIGAGPSGCAAASYIQLNSNLKVGIIEQKEFPRFQIGESLLPASVPILKEIGVFDRLNSGKYIQKRGARFVESHSEEEIYFRFADCEKKDLDYAFEVPRNEFDSDLLEHAQSLGVDVIQPVKINTIEEKNDHILLASSSEQYSARYVIDASGRSALISTKLKQNDAKKDFNNVAIFNHFTGVQRARGDQEGDITIGVLEENTWCWIIPFLGEATSVGIVTTSSQLEKSHEEFFYHQLFTSPVLKRNFENAKPVSTFQTVANYSRQSQNWSGRRWVTIGDALAFLDPIFSSGVHVGLSTAKIATSLVIPLIEKGEDFESIQRAYRCEVEKGINRFRSLIQLFYGDQFIRQMKKTLGRENINKAFTAAIAGDVWDDQNPLFRMGVL